MTQSHMGATGAPVMMRSAWPRATSKCFPQPAQASPTTVSTTGASREAPAMSPLCNA